MKQVMDQVLKKKQAANSTVVSSPPAQAPV